MDRREFLAGIGAAVLAIGLAAPGPGRAGEINRTAQGLALHGHDPVAYFTRGAPVAGRPEHRLEWRGAVWQFVDADHLARFAATPEAYAPQYGGYCAWAVAENYTADIDPRAWHIADGKLYLNDDRRIRDRWLADMPARIARGDANWPAIAAALGGD